MRRFISVAVGFLLVAACSQSPVEVNERSFVEWVDASALVLDTDGWPATTPEELEILEDCVSGAQVVMVGEPDHHITEKYEYRLVVIRYLVEQGFRWVGTEMGYSDGLQVDEYLETGDSAYLDQVALYGYQGHARADRDDVPTPFAALMNASFQTAFVEAELSFLDSLRALSEPPADRLHWFGFDIDPFPGGGYSDLERLLVPYEVEPKVAYLMARLARVPDETRLEEAERLEALEVHLDEEAQDLESLLGADDVGEIRRIVRNLIESLRFRDLAYQEPFGSRWMDGLRYREAALIDRIDHHWPPPDDAKVILMGHNFHLSKNGAELRSGSVEEAGPTLGYASFGSGVADRMDTCTIWMLYNRGTSADSLAADPYFEVAADPDRIEHLLSGIGPTLILDLAGDDPRATWLDRETNFLSNGGYASGSLRRQADVIFFVDRVHAVGLGE